MAVVTTAVVGAAAAAGSLYMSAKQASDGAKQAKEAKKAIEEYNRQKLENPYANLKVSTAGADLAREESARNYANSVNLIQSSGMTGLSVLPQLTASQNNLNRQIGADLDRQYIQNENMKAQGQGMVMGMQEQREIADLAGLGQQMWVGEQNKYTGIQNTVKAIPGFVSGINNGINTVSTQIKTNKAMDAISQMDYNNTMRAQYGQLNYPMMNTDPTGGLLPWNSGSLGGWY